MNLPGQGKIVDIEWLEKVSSQSSDRVVVDLFDYGPTVHRYSQHIVIACVLDSV